MLRVEADKTIGVRLAIQAAVFLLFLLGGECAGEAGDSLIVQTGWRSA